MNKDVRIAWGPRLALAFFLVVVGALRCAWADVAIALVEPVPGQPGLPRLDIQLIDLAPRAYVPVQHKPQITVTDWIPYDFVLTDSGGDGSTSFFIDPTLPGANQHFFRAVFPAPQINLVQPSVVSTSSTTVFLIGQVFDPSMVVKIDGNTVASTFTDANTLMIMTGGLTVGFHTITLLDSMSNTLVTLTNGLQVTSTGRTDQESPPEPPAVNQANIVRGEVVDVKTVEGEVVQVSGGNMPPGPPENPWLDPGDIPPGAYWSGGMLMLPPGVTSNNDTEAGTSQASPHVAGSLMRGNERLAMDADTNNDGQPDQLSFNLKVHPLFAVPRVNEATGEVFVSYLDLVIPGRGLDLVWGRTYRSKIGMDTAMGVGWDFSYNIRAAQNGSNITVQDGQNRTDTYFLQIDGSYSTDELFRRGTLTGLVFTLQFADKTSWVFKALDGSPTSGKIDKIIDRNSNQIQFQYDGAGRLFLIIDSLGKPFQIGYDGAGRIQFVQDFAGRQLIYTHHTGVGPGGSLGDLLAVRSPVVTGTPTGNDFSSGKTAQFTYSVSLGGARDHNLLTARDGLNVQWLQFNYTPATLTTDPLYDRAASEVIGTAGETTVYTYLPQTPSAANRFATTKAIVNDAVGNVHESLFDSRNRLIDLRQFTGRSTPGIPVTEVTNRPTGQLRAGDPPSFKTTIDWNRDSLPTRLTFPRGDGREFVYERDLDAATNPRLRANLRVFREVPVSGAPLVQRFEYQPGFGMGEMRFRPGRWSFTDYNFEKPITSIALATDASGLSATGMCVSNIVAERARRRFSDALISEIQMPKLDGAAREPAYMPITFASLPIDADKNGFDEYLLWTAHTDARGFTWTCARDANGNAMSVTRPDGVTTDIEHNANGQLTAVVWPQNHTGHRERDEWHYYTSGAQTGYLQSFIRDAGGLNLTTGFTHNSVGCITQVVDPRGRDVQFFVNQLDQVVQVTSRDVGGAIRYLTNIFRDANNRITSVDVQSKDEFGVVGANQFFTTSYIYDSLDRMTSMTQEVDSGHNVTTQYFYNAIGDLTEVRSPVAVTAVQPDARIQYSYDERNLPFTTTRAPGSGNATAFVYTYDANGNLTKHEAGAPAGLQHTTVYTYDGFDRSVSMTDAVGTQLQVTRNPNHQVISFSEQGTLLDANGNPIVRPLRNTVYVYDSRGVLTQRSDGWFDRITSATIGDGARVTTYTYDPVLNLTGVTDDNAHTWTYSYDDANRFVRTTDPKGNRIDYTYDANGNLVTRMRTDKSDSAAPDQIFTATYVYDGLDRRITAMDNVGNTESYSYDSRGNLVRRIDPRNGTTQYDYDGLNRLIRTGRDLNGNNFGYDGPDIVTTYTYDDNSRLITGSDPNLRTTQYQYDPLDRRILHTNPDTTTQTWTYDAWGNVVQRTDENGTVTIHTYDALNRLTQRQVTPGAGVSSATTFETYDYPGHYPQAERAINDEGAVRFTYDSLGQCTTERQGNLTTTYTYDGAGNLTTLTSPGGRTLTYTYDLANHPLTVNLTTTSDGDTLGQMRSFSYVGERLEQSTQRNGTTTTYTYAGLAGASPTPTPSPSPSASPSSGWGRVATQTTRGPGSVLLDQRTYTYDRSQNLTDREDTRPGGPQLRFHYDYDPADRDVHTQVTSGGPALRDTTYTYDPMGNRLNVGGLNTPNPGGYFQDATTPSPADAQMHQYTTTPLGSYMYDANGNRINLNGGGGNTNFKYDYANRLIDLTNVNTGLRIANYQYDALGRRIQKTLDPDGTPSVTNFVYTGRTVLEERDAGGAVTAAYSLFWSPGYDWVEPCVVATVDPYRGEGVSWYSGDSSSWEHQFEFAIDRTPMGESEIWWFSLRSMDTGKTWQRLASGDGRLMVMHGRHGIDGEDVTLTNIYDMSTAPIEIRRGGVNYAYHAEVVPWLWLMTNSSGAAAERYDYEDFGDPHVFDGSGTPLITSAIGNTYLFKGMRFDAESGLYCITKNLDCSSPSFFNFDPKIGASLQRESNHAVNGWGGVLCAIDTFIWFEEQAGRAKK